MDSIFPYVESFPVKLPLTCPTGEQCAGVINQDSLHAFFILVAFPFTCDSFLALELSTYMSWCHPSSLPGRSSCWPIVSADSCLLQVSCRLLLPCRFLPIYWWPMILTIVLAMVDSFLSFRADNSPMHTHISLCVLVSCMCVDFIS
jgi:hypothetical protein